MDNKIMNKSKISNSRSNWLQDLSETCNLPSYHVCDILIFDFANPAILQLIEKMFIF